LASEGCTLVHCGAPGGCAERGRVCAEHPENACQHPGCRRQYCGEHEEENMTVCNVCDGQVYTEWQLMDECHDTCNAVWCHEHRGMLKKCTTYRTEDEEQGTFDRPEEM